MKTQTYGQRSNVHAGNSYIIMYAIFNHCVGNASINIRSVDLFVERTVAERQGLLLKNDIRYSKIWTVGPLDYCGVA